MIIDAATTPFQAGHAYRLTFDVRGLGWLNDWTIARVKERVWDACGAHGLRLLKWETDPGSFTVTFDKVADGDASDQPQPKAAFVVVAFYALIIASAATSLILALTVALRQAEDLGSNPAAALSFTGWAILAAVVVVVVAVAAVLWKRGG